MERTDKSLEDTFKDIFKDDPDSYNEWYYGSHFYDYHRNETTIAPYLINYSISDVVERFSPFGLCDELLLFYTIVGVVYGAYRLIQLIWLLCPNNKLKQRLQRK